MNGSRKSTHHHPLLSVVFDEISLDSVRSRLWDERGIKLVTKCKVGRVVCISILMHVMKSEPLSEY